MAEHTGIDRQIDTLGRIVIPIEIRRRLGIEAGDAVSIWLSDNGKSILIARPTEQCSFCEATDDLRSYRDRLVCTTCITAIEQQFAASA